MSDKMIVSHFVVWQSGRVRQTVVVVDDDEALREIIVDVLTLGGYVAQTACDGDEAVRVLRSAPRPCIAIVDLIMPRVDGWALIEAIAREPALRDVPIICSTAGRHEPPPGCHSVLRKPFNDEELLAAVRDAFAAPH